MTYYLYAQTACAVKIDGNFVGTTDGNYFAFEADEYLLEVIPLDDRMLPVAFLVKNEPRKTPSMKVFDMRGGYLLIPVFSRRFVTDFRLLFRGRKEFSCGTLAVTCYSENGVRVVVETMKDMFVTTLPFLPDDARFDYIKDGEDEYLAAVFVGNRTLVLVFSIKEKISLALKRVCDDYSFQSPYISLTENKNDILKHVVVSRWKLCRGEIKGVSLLVKRRREIYTVDEKLLPYAFFEELALGGDVTDFLAPKIKPRAGEMKEFAGNFTAVLPPPEFVSPSLVTLLYPDRIEYADVTVSGGLIENIVIT